jgi:uncharacterized membrane protein YgcG
MMASMANGTLLGVKYPKNLARAYETAAQYVVPPEKLKKPAGTSASTYLTSEESDRVKTSGSRGGRGGPTGGGRGAGGRGARNATAKKGSPPPNKLLKKTVKFKDERTHKTAGK